MRIGSRSAHHRDFSTAQSYRCTSISLGNRRDGRTAPRDSVRLVSMLIIRQSVCNRMKEFQRNLVREEHLSSLLVDDYTWNRQMIRTCFFVASFIFILRYQSSIPTIERLPQRLITSTTSCLIDRTIPCLIVRLKGFWLTLLTLVSCMAFIVVFQWPKLQFDVCRLTFDALPISSAPSFDEKSLHTLDIDVTYYVGSSWEIPTESLVPLRDIPVLSYMSEDRMTSIADGVTTFSRALQENLTQLIQFCASVHDTMNKKQLEYTNHQPRSASDSLHNNSTRR